MKHISGSKMEKADGLSRRPDWEVGVEKNNEEQILVKKVGSEKDSGGRGDSRRGGPTGQSEKVQSKKR